MKIQGTRVWLTAFTEAHLVAPRYLEWLRDMEVVRYIGREEYLTPIPFEEVRAYVEEVWANPLCTFFAVHSAADDEFLGTTKLNYLNQAGVATRTADVGIMIGDRRYWGKGLATDAICTVSHHAFDALEARKLTAGAVGANEAVLKAFLKVGYREEGRLRRKLLVEGEYEDHVLFGCFPDELVVGV
jgi:RimJ/RimL family protein N-acetyltransferase